MATWTKKQGIRVFRQALLEVSPSYFSVQTPDGKARHRERILAYELYHQLRRVIPEEHGQLHGEYVKALSTVPQLDTDQIYVPDLVLHESGTMDANFIAVEVKSSDRTTAKQLVADISKLDYYTTSLKFKIGIMLLANRKLSDVLKGEPESIKQIKSISSKNGRVAVWNVAEPVGARIPYEDFRDLRRLDESCLKIFMANELENLSE